MRIRDILNETHSDFDVAERVEGESVVVYAVSRDEKPVQIGSITMNEATIVSVDINEDEKGHREAFTEMMAYLCDRQDKQNIPIALIADKLKTGMKRKFESFGFVMGDDNIMVRRPGAVLPIAHL